MDPREEMYTALIKALKGVEGVKHVSLWNKDTDFLEEDAPWERPAVFIELGDITWTVLKGCMRGRGDVKLHTVIDWSEDAPVEAWRLTDRLWTAMSQVEGDIFGGFYPSMTLPNRSHEELFENIDVFSVTYLKEIDNG